MNLPSANRADRARSLRQIANFVDDISRTRQKAELLPIVASGILRVYHEPETDTLDVAVSSLGDIRRIVLSRPAVLRLWEELDRFLTVKDTAA